VAEWKGVLKQVEVRPLLGYGFGTEEKVFVDRWYYFQGGTAENSYLGILLQLGALGLLLLGGLGLLLIAAAIRTLRRTPLDRRGEVAAELGVLGAAASLMLIQSYIYSVGNVATAIAWISLFLLGSRVLGKAADGAPA
jgi:O-antigen ligase